MRNTRLLPFLFAALLMSVSGCGVNATHVPAVLPPPPSPTLLNCTQNPPSLSLQVIFGTREGSFQNIRVEGKGFTPNERLSIVTEGHGVSHTRRLEVSDFPVNADGNFADLETLQLDEPNMRWQVFVVHKRGIACASFTTE